MSQALEDVGQGWQGWEDYAAFYDWENERTLGRRDVRFWTGMVRRLGGPVLELGCGTGRVTGPVAGTGVRVVGVDRAWRMLQLARRRFRRRRADRRPHLVRADIRRLPFGAGARFPLVIAPYGILQSLLSDRDLDETLRSVASVLAPGGTFAIDLVPDLPHWQEYRRRVRLRGTRSAGRARVALVETVTQDRSRGLTIFDQEFVERRGSRTARHRFTLRFRTLTVPQMSRRLRRAGLRVTTTLGDYDGGPWRPRADVWLMLAQPADAS